jgi:hypothetical protein
MGSRLRKSALVGLAALLAASPAVAGPPYITDDPEPTGLGKWEVYAFGDGSIDHGDYDGVAGLDLNYGAAPDVQLTATLPMDVTSAARPHAAFGDAEVAVKYRFLHDERRGLSLAVFPRLIMPTSGHGEASFLLPVWGQLDRGNWSLFGGGGYAVRGGAGSRNSWIEGVALTRNLSDKLNLGVELAHEGAESRDGHGVTTAGLGMILALGGPVSLLVSGGPEFEDGTGHRSVHAYAALGFDF